MKGDRCSFCEKMAIGYETRTNCGVNVCEDHASKIILTMKPGEVRNETPKRSWWQKRAFIWPGGYYHRYDMESYD